jgi:hypothetical protein
LKHHHASFSTPCSLTILSCCQRPIAPDSAVAAVCCCCMLLCCCFAGTIWTSQQTPTGGTT